MAAMNKSENIAIFSSKLRLLNMCCMPSKSRNSPPISATAGNQLVCHMEIMPAKPMDMLAKPSSRTIFQEVLSFMPRMPSAVSPGFIT